MATLARVAILAICPVVAVLTGHRREVWRRAFMEAGEKESKTPPLENDAADASPDSAVPEAARAAPADGSPDAGAPSALEHIPPVSSPAEQIGPADGETSQRQTDGIEPPLQAPADTGPLQALEPESPDEFAAILARETRSAPETETVVVVPTDTLPAEQPSQSTPAEAQGATQVPGTEVPGTEGQMQPTTGPAPRAAHSPQPPDPVSEYASQVGDPGQEITRRGIHPAVWILAALILLLFAAGVAAFTLNLGNSERGGVSSTPVELAQTFYQRLGNHDYAGAHSLLAEGVAAGNSPEEFKAAWEAMEAETNARFQSADVSSVVEARDTATTSVKVRLTGDVELEPVTVTMQKFNNGWLITGFE